MDLVRYGAMPGYVSIDLGSWFPVGLKGTLCVTGSCQAMYVVELGSWLASCRVKRDLVRYGVMPGTCVLLSCVASWLPVGLKGPCALRGHARLCC